MVIALSLLGTLALAAYFESIDQPALGMSFVVLFTITVGVIVLSDHLPILSVDGKVKPLGMWLHKYLGRISSEPLTVERSRRALAEKAELGRRLWELHDRIKDFPTWYQTRPPSWRGSRVFPEDRFTQPTPDELAAIDIGRPQPSAFHFSAQQATYCFCVTHSAVRREEEAEWALIAAFQIYVFERPQGPVVLQLRVTTSHIGVGGGYNGSDVEVFRLGPWLAPFSTSLKRPSKSNGKSLSESRWNPASRHG
jgi:hypothetical protein